jgi:hypothetical protein
MHKELLWWNILDKSRLEEPYRNGIVINVWELGEQIIEIWPDVNWVRDVCKGSEILVCLLKVSKFSWNWNVEGASDGGFNVIKTKQAEWVYLAQQFKCTQFWHKETFASDINS